MAIVAGALAALGAGALLSLALLGEDGEVGASDSPTPSPMASASAGDASPSASLGASEEPTSSPTPATAAIIPNLSIAEAIEAVSLRSAPDEQSEVLRELAVGQRLYVVGEPTETDDLYWYRVAAVTDSDCADRCPIGYVATPRSAADDAWVERVDVDCPTSPMTEETLASLHSLVALHCFGSGDIVVTGTITLGLMGALPGPIVYTPAWLAQPGQAVHLVHGRGRGHALRAHPDTDLPDVQGGDEVRVTGHFEDPEATTCRASISPDVPDEDRSSIELPEPAAVVLMCRATFVWTDFDET